MWVSGGGKRGTRRKEQPASSSRGEVATAKAKSLDALDWQIPWVGQRLKRHLRDEAGMLSTVRLTLAQRRFSHRHPSQSSRVLAGEFRRALRKYSFPFCCPFPVPTSLSCHHFNAPFAQHSRIPSHSYSPSRIDLSASSNDFYFLPQVRPMLSFCHATGGCIQLGLKYVVGEMVWIESRWMRQVHPRILFLPEVRLQLRFVAIEPST